MVVAMFIRNGKTGIGNKCPFDNSEMKSIYDYTHYTGSFTEYPEDLLPLTFKKANVESIVILECQTCQKRFIGWENWISKAIIEFHEAKIIPDNSFAPRDDEAGMTQPQIPEDNSKGGLNSPEASNCDCGGECDNHDCGNNKMNLNNGKFDRPVWYG